MHVCNNKRPTGLKGHLSTITFRLTCQRVLGFIVNPCGWMGGGRGESEDGGILNYFYLNSRGQTLETRGNKKPASL